MAETNFKLLGDFQELYFNIFTAENAESRRDENLFRKKLNESLRTLRFSFLSLLAATPLKLPPKVVSRSGP